MSADNATEAVNLQRKAKGKRPYYFSNPDVDRLLSMVMALTGELAVTRDRLDTLERVAASKGLFSAEDIEAYELDAEAMEARAARHQGIFREVTRIIVTELEDLQVSSEQEYTQVVDFVENDG